MSALPDQSLGKHLPWGAIPNKLSDHSAPFPLMNCVGFLLSAPLEFTHFVFIHITHDQEQNQPIASSYWCKLHGLFHPMAVRGELCYHIASLHCILAMKAFAQLQFTKSLEPHFFFLSWYQGINNKNTGKKVQSSS